jgi:hypothetical protein
VIAEHMLADFVSSQSFVSEYAHDDCKRNSHWLKEDLHRFKKRLQRAVCMC